MATPHHRQPPFSKTGLPKCVSPLLCFARDMTALDALFLSEGVLYSSRNILENTSEAGSAVNSQTVRGRSLRLRRSGAPTSVIPLGKSLRVSPLSFLSALPWLDFRGCSSERRNENISLNSRIEFPTFPPRRTPGVQTTQTRHLC